MLYSVCVVQCVCVCVCVCVYVSCARLCLCGCVRGFMFVSGRIAKVRSKAIPGNSYLPLDVV